MELFHPKILSGSFFRYLKNGLSCLVRPKYLLLSILGLSAWLLPEPGTDIEWNRLLYLAFIEEFIFRFFLQDLLRQVLAGKFFKQLSASNLSVSFVFALLHLYSHPPLWALSVFFPSLVFGWVWDKYRNIVPCWMLHFLYNFLYFYRI